MKHTLFGAVWCANCNSVKPIIDNSGIDYTYVDIDNPENVGVVQSNNIRSLPTLVTESGDRYVGLLKIKEYVNSQGN